MSPQLQRARLLREHRRHEEAIGLLYEHISNFPQDPYGHMELALNRLEMPGERPKALDDINAAIALDPDEPVMLALKTSILCRLGREKEALSVADAAVALDPHSAFVWTAKAEALGGLMRWSEGEAAARQALEIDPDSPSGSNLLAHFLRMQNKLGESEQESHRRLERDPENPFSLATSAWAAL